MGKLRLLLKDLFHLPEVSLAIFFAVSLAVSSLFFSLLFFKGVNSGIKTGLSRLGADLVVVPKGKGSNFQETLISGKPNLFYFSDISKELLKINGVEKASPELFIKSVPASCCTEGNVFLISIDPETDFIISPWIFKGEKSLKGDEVITGFNVKRPVGLHLFFYNHRYKVVANLQETGWGFFDNGVFLPLETAYKMAAESLRREDTRNLYLSPPQVSAIFLRVNDPPQVKEEIEKRYNYVEVVEMSALLPKVRQNFSSLSRGLFVVSGLLWMIVVVLVGALFYLMGERRKREMALFRAIGGTKKTLFKIVLFEAIFLSLGGGIVGILLGALISFLFRTYLIVVLKTPFLFPSSLESLPLAFLVLLFSVLAASLASLYPASFISSKEPQDGLRG
jgi:putative ABC transport system permease protein